VLNESNESTFLKQEQENPPGYYASRWIWLNRLLDNADSVAGRSAGLFHRLFSFLLIGGIGAIINILCFTITYASLIRLTAALVAYFVAFFLATEISIMTNFVLNDSFTFRHLHGSDRSWQIRCLRFHATTIGGVVLTMSISFSLLHFLHVLALLSQAIALLVATSFNFAGHHIFTYRRFHKRNLRGCTR
jgi:putative flippase GtrA